MRVRTAVAVVLLAVWWSWNYTTWVTNELDPEAVAIRLLLIGLMLAGLAMAVAIMGGLVVATVLTCLFLPALYAAWFRVKEPDSMPTAA